jgi:hypothetical protein
MNPQTPSLNFYETLFISSGFINHFSLTHNTLPRLKSTFSIPHNMADDLAQAVFKLNIQNQSPEPPKSGAVHLSIPLLKLLGIPNLLN